MLPLLPARVFQSESGNSCGTVSVIGSYFLNTAMQKAIETNVKAPAKRKAWDDLAQAYQIMLSEWKPNQPSEEGSNGLIFVRYPSVFI